MASLPNNSITHASLTCSRHGLRAGHLCLPCVLPRGGAVPAAEGLEEPGHPRDGLQQRVLPITHYTAAVRCSRGGGPAGVASAKAQHIQSGGSGGVVEVATLSWAAATARDGDGGWTEQQRNPRAVEGDDQHQHLIARAWQLRFRTRGAGQAKLGAQTHSFPVDIRTTTSSAHCRHILMSAVHY